MVFIISKLTLQMQGEISVVLEIKKAVLTRLILIRKDELLGSSVCIVFQRFKYVSFYNRYRINWLWLLYNNDLQVGHTLHNFRIVLLIIIK
jgi:hypothetical protein